MKIRRLLLSLLLIVVLMPSTGLVNGQSAPFALRTFAERNGIYIGAAAWTNHLDDPVHAEVMAREFNMFTPEHEAKWCMISTGPGEYDFSKFDRLVEFAEAHDMVIHGHTLVWHSCSPDWVENAEWSRDEAIEVLREHITTVVGRYKGRILYWDVTNEVFDGAELRDTAWLRMIGPEYVELSYQFAHEADPDAILLYNDWGIEHMNEKSNAVYAMAQDFIARGIPLHGIGWQGHFDLGAINFASLQNNMERLSELGLEVQFTEVDVKYLGEADSETYRKQAADYYRLMELCLDNANCTAFVVWGVSDKYTWLRTVSFFDNPTVGPLLFDDDYKPKLAYYALISLLAERAGSTPILDEGQIADILGETGTEEVASDVPVPTKSDPAQLSPDPIPGAVYYAPMGVSINLDGDLSDWENVPRAMVDYGTATGPGAESYEFALAADDTNLYFMANVTDENVLFLETDWWQEDGVEWLINATGDLALGAYEPGVVQIAMLAGNATSEEPLLYGNSSDTSQVSFTVVETETGYVVEAAVPLVTDVWEIVPENMGVLGFNTGLNGTSGGDRDTKLIWSAADTNDQSWQNPSVFGQLVFWEEMKPTKSDPNQIAPDSIPGEIVYAPMGVTVELDGDLSDWENVPRALVDYGTATGPGAESYEFALAADDTNLYFMADVTDENVLFLETDWWQEDGVEWLINATGDLGLEAYEPGVVQIAMLAGNATAEDVPLYGNSSGDAQVSFVVVETETGYVVEASVPLVTDVWEIVPEHMGVLGFNTGLNGNSGGDRDTKLIWSAADTTDQSWQNPSVFGQLVFWDVAR